jgi:hypothetical protein
MFLNHTVQVVDDVIVFSMSHPVFGGSKVGSGPCSIALQHLVAILKWTLQMISCSKATRHSVSFIENMSIQKRKFNLKKPFLTMKWIITPFDALNKTLQFHLSKTHPRILYLKNFQRVLLNQFAMNYNTIFLQKCHLFSS